MPSDGVNLVFWDEDNDATPPTDVWDADLDAATLALTAIHTSAVGGVILESDIVFNGDDFTWSTLADGVPLGANHDVQTVALHEIGHFIGLHHSEVAAAAMEAFEGTPGGNTQQTLDADDQNGANFLYTPDLGTAPEPYPTKVQAGNSARVLNGVTLKEPNDGAVHLFGYGPTGDRYEWLGATEDGKPAECSPADPLGPPHNDGVEFEGLPPTKGEQLKIKVTVTINDSGNHTGNRYLNGWIDWEGDGVWQTTDNKVIGTGNTACNPTGTQTFTATETREYTCTVPNDLNSGGDHIWARFRVDYKEDVGHQKPAGGNGFADNNLLEDKYVAAFGEVEDYILTPSVGGTVELLASGSDAPVQPVANSGASVPYAAVASGIAAAGVVLAAGGWYARRRLS